MALARGRRWFALSLNRVQPQSHGERRYQRILQATLTGFVGKGVAIVVSILAVPLALRYLGSERYGLWMTVSTLLIWLNLADFGLGNGLTNRLAEAYGQDRPDLAQQYVATAFWLLVGIVCVVGAAFAVVWSWVDWSALFKVESLQAKNELAPVMAVAILLFLVSLPFSLIPKILNAYQEGVVANGWLTLGSVASLIGLVVVTRVGGGLVQLVIAYSGSILAVTICSAIWLFVKHKPWLLPRWSSIRRSHVAGIASVGGMFFVVQIAGLLIFQSNNLIIAHYLGVSEVTPYSVAYRLFTYTVLLQTLIVPTLWPAFGEALARGDTSWISRTLRLNLILSPLIAAAFAVPLVVLGRQIIRVWAGSEAVPSFTLLVLLGLWSVIYAFMTAIGTFLNGVGRLKGQMVYSLITAVASVGMAIWLVPIYGAIGAIIGMIVSVLVCEVVPASVETRFVAKKIRSSASIQ